MKLFTGRQGNQFRTSFTGIGEGQQPNWLDAKRAFERANSAGTTCFKPAFNDQRGRHNIGAVAIAVNNYY